VLTDGVRSGAPAIGLSVADAEQRRRDDGPNRLPEPKRQSGARRFLGELVHFFALMLWVAGALALVAGMPALGFAIFAVIVVNAVFSFVQEHRADVATQRLRQLLPTMVTVRRGGRPVIVDAEEVVVGDVLLVEAGDRVPADAVVLSAACFLVDTSLLTGESVPSPGAVNDPLFAGTFVVEGSAAAVVTATGGATRLATIAALATVTAKPVTPLTVGLHQVVRTIAGVAVGVGAFFFGIALLLGNDPSDGFVFAIGVTVALVPEALLPTVTLSLAWGAERMAERQVLVRNLEAVETLGSTTFICTDKTGTLTMNQMTVRSAWTPNGTATVTALGYGPVAGGHAALVSGCAVDDGRARRDDRAGPAGPGDRRTPNGDRRPTGRCRGGRARPRTARSGGHGGPASTRRARRRGRLPSCTGEAGDGDRRPPRHRGRSGDARGAAQRRRRRDHRCRTARRRR